jgi:flavin-dependent dehydrogenase/SAM-dependent methyltransferase
LLRIPASYRILDVATGAADIPLAVARWARERGTAVEIVATDNHPPRWNWRAQAVRGEPSIRVETADALRLPYADGSFDVALCSTALHHFDDDEDAVRVLRELDRVSRIGFVVNDLARSRTALLGARLLAITVWRTPPVTRHDGPLSVRRALTAPEMRRLAERAGLADGTVRGHFPFRLALVVDKGVADGHERRAERWGGGGRRRAGGLRRGRAPRRPRPRRARAGPRRFPRRKPCARVREPRRRGRAPRPGRLGRRRRGRAFGRLDGWRIQSNLAGGDASFDGAFPDATYGIAIERAVFDTLLLDHAAARGATVRTGVRVTDLLREGDAVAGVRVSGPEGEMEVGARLVIGADGLRSIVLRRLGLVRRAPKLRKLALNAHVTGWAGKAGRGEVHVSKRGCVGVADVGGGRANVTVVAAGEETHAVGGDADGYFDRALEDYGFAGLTRVDAVLATGPFDFPVRRAVADGALLVGDAAGYYDPFTGQGIYRALHGARLAADAADAALRVGNVSAAALMPYERARRRAFAPGERMQRVVEAFVARPTWLAAVADRFTRRPALGDAMIRITGDVVPVRALLRPGLVAGLFL